MRRNVLILLVVLMTAAAPGVQWSVCGVHRLLHHGAPSSQTDKQLSPSAGQHQAAVILPRADGVPLVGAWRLVGIKWACLAALPLALGDLPVAAVAGTGPAAAWRSGPADSLLSRHSLLTV
jgi:hypothetical protein